MQRLPRGSNDGRVGMVVAVGFDLVPLHTSTSMYLHGKPREICCGVPAIPPADQSTYREHDSCRLSILSLPSFTIYLLHSRPGAVHFVFCPSLQCKSLSRPTSSRFFPDKAHYTCLPR